MLIKLSLISALLLFSLELHAQWRPERGLNFLCDTEAEFLVLDFKFDQIDVFAMNAYKFSRIKTLVIKECNDTEKLIFLEDLPRLRSLYIENSKNLAPQLLIHFLLKRNTVRNLHLINTNINKIPANLRKLSSLSTLELSELKSVKSLDRYLKKLNGMDSLLIPELSFNQFDRVFAKKFRSIDYIEVKATEGYNDPYPTIPFRMGTLCLVQDRNTDFMEYPLFDRPYQNVPEDSLLGFGNVSNAFYGNSFPWFAALKPYSWVKIPLQMNDTPGVEYIPEEEEKRFGQFRVGAVKTRAYSDAYLKFEPFMKSAMNSYVKKGKGRQVYSLDTSNIYRRYEKLYYAGENFLRYLYQPGDPVSIRHFFARRTLIREYQHLLHFKKFRELNGAYLIGFDREIAYEKYRKMMSTFPELKYLEGYKWFVKKTAAEKLISGDYYDIRLKYNYVSDQLSMELKHSTGFELFEFNVDFPRTDTSLKKNFNLYSKYSTHLKVRLRRSQNRIEQLKKHMTPDTLGTWAIFRRSFSPEEQKMNRNEWINYRSSILRWESTSLENSAATWVLLNRYLQLQGFRNINLFTWCKSYPQVYLKSSPFELSDSICRSVAAIHVIDLEQKTIVTFNGHGKNQIAAPLRTAIQGKSGIPSYRFYNRDDGCEACVFFYVPYTNCKDIKILVEMIDGSLSYIPYQQYTVYPRYGTDFPVKIADLRMILQKIQS